MSSTFWYHEVNLDWMESRRNFVTASQISKFVPYTPTGRPRDVSAQWEQWLGEYYSFEEPDVTSKGAAARGHILEPYAIAEYNEATHSNMYFWDDMLLARGFIGWSPDGCDIEQPDTPDESCRDGRCHLISDKDENDCEFLQSITAGCDVKSYSSGKHMLTAFTDKFKLEERWQLAAAMYVCEQIQTMDLILYNPESVGAMYVHNYSRDDLADELAIIAEIDKTAYQMLFGEQGFDTTEADLVCLHSKLLVSYSRIKEEYEMQTDF